MIFYVQTHHKKHITKNTSQKTHHKKITFFQKKVNTVKKFLIDYKIKKKKLNAVTPWEG